MTNQNRRGFVRASGAAAALAFVGGHWTEQGRSPLWLVAAERAGKKWDSFVINSAKAEKVAKSRKKKG